MSYNSYNSLVRKAKDVAMKTAVQFLLLYFYSFFLRLLTLFRRTPEGIRGEAVFLFVDPDYPGVHGVVAFVLPVGSNPDYFDHDLWGPFGYSSDITIAGKHLYGRDTWGEVTPKQIKANKVLGEIVSAYPNQTILLAGVRKVFGRHPWPLYQAKKYILVGK